jgi:hypothetical protein
VFHITRAAGRYVDRFILIGEVLTLLGFAVYYFTNWLDAYRDRLFLALFLVLGTVAFLHGGRCKSLVWGIMGIVAAVLLIVSIILYATSLNPTILEYSPLALGLGTLLAILSLLFGTPDREK